jgi:hypothetical protein
MQNTRKLERKNKALKYLSPFPDHQLRPRKLNESSGATGNKDINRNYDILVVSLKEYGVRRGWSVFISLFLIFAFISVLSFIFTK